MAAVTIDAKEGPRSTPYLNWKTNFQFCKFTAAVVTAVPLELGTTNSEARCTIFEFENHFAVPLIN